MAKSGFAKIIKNFFSSKRTLDSKYFEDLADMLVEGDFGAKLAFEIADELEAFCAKNKIADEDGIKAELKRLMLKEIKSISFSMESTNTNIFMVLGVNGAGKTTSVGKLALWYKNSGIDTVVMAASDTYRAAAIDQLKVHGERTGIRVIAHKDGADPGAVVFDAAESVSAKGGGIVFCDTAGRLHNKENLVRELQKIDRIAASKASPSCYKKLLVLDCTTGQNAFRQAEVFNEAVGVDAVVLTKYDSTAKGGVAYSLGKELGIPVAFYTFGEHYEHIAPFDTEKYVDDFLGNV